MYISNSKDLSSFSSHSLFNLRTVLIINLAWKMLRCPTFCCFEIKQKLSNNFENIILLIVIYRILLGKFAAVFASGWLQEKYKIN
jgi:hypothetical protein